MENLISLVEMQKCMERGINGTTEGVKGRIRPQDWAQLGNRQAGAVHDNRRKD